MIRTINWLAGNLYDFYAFTSYSLTPNPCSENFVPPAKKHIPKTSTKIAIISIRSLGEAQAHSSGAWEEM